jgi:DNA sulfur modification protein DndD
MRIKKIKLKNYRQFFEQTIDFTIHHDCDLHLFVGHNGTGKTNILNAISWCLTEKEPYLNLDSQGFPILNLKSFGEIGIGGSSETLVEVTFQSKEHGDFTFLRKLKTIKISENEWKLERTDFQGYYYDESLNRKEISSESLDSYVTRILPPTMRNYYFFDGEALFNYFKEDIVKKVRDAIFILSKVDILDKIANNLNNIKRDYEKEMKKLNPGLENLYLEKDQFEDEIKSHKSEVENKLEYKKQLMIKLKEIEEYFKYSIPPEKLENYKDNKEKVERDLKEKKKTLENKKNERFKLIFHDGLKTFVVEAVNNFLTVVKKDTESGKIPPPIRSDVVQKILKEGVCEVCGKKLDGEARKKVEALCEKVSINSGVGDILRRFENPLIIHHDEVCKTLAKLKGLNREIKGFEDDTQKLESDFKEFDEMLKKFDIAESEEKIGQKKDIEKELEIVESEIEENKINAGHSEKKLQDVLKDIEREETKKEQYEETYNKMKILENSSKLAKDLEKVIMDEAREGVKNKTKANFESLIWKKMTYKDLSIDENYMVHLYNKSGIECLGTAGATEREFLALAFTLALHSESGFDLPIFIDTPIGRASGINREKFANVILEIAKEKQIVLLMNPNEYSSEISGVFQKKFSNKFEMLMSSDELLTELRRE